MVMTEQVRDLLSILMEVDLDFSVRSGKNEIVVGEAYLIQYNPLLSDFTVIGTTIGTTNDSYSTVQGVVNHVLGISN